MRFALLASLLCSGCFAELAAGPGIALGGAGGVGFSVGVVVGANYDPVSPARVAVAGEFRANKTHANAETFEHSAWGLSVLGDVALLSAHDSQHLKSLRLRLGGGWAPVTNLALTPDVSGTRYVPERVGPPTETFAGGREAIPHTTWSATAGLAYDSISGPLFVSIGPDVRLDAVPSRWMGDVYFVTPQVRLSVGLTADGFIEWMSGVDWSHVKVRPPPAWLKPLPKGPDTSHSTDDMNKANDAARKAQEDAVKERKRNQSCANGGPC